MEQLGEFILNHWELWLALVVILSLILLNELMSQKKRAKELAPASAVKLINHESAQVIDLRPQDAFKEGHIINALRASEADFEKEKLKKFKQKPLVLVCARGLQARTLASRLKTQGFEHLYVLAGGMQAWQSADLPLVKGK